MIPTTTAPRAEDPPETARQEGRREGHPGTRILGDPGCLEDHTARLEDRPEEDRPEEDHREAARPVTTDDL